MKVLIALHDYLPRHVGGSELHAHQVACELLARGHDVAAVFTERDTEAPEGDVRFGELDGVRTIELVHQREFADLRDTWHQPFFVEAFGAILARERPDVVHFHQTSFLGAACLEAARAAGARVVVTLHDFHLPCAGTTLMRSDGSLCDGGGARGDCSDCLEPDLLRPARWPEFLVEGQDGARLFDWDAAIAAAARERRAWHRQALAAAHVVVSPSRFLAERFRATGFLATPGQVVEVLPYGCEAPRRAPRARGPITTEDPLRVGYAGGLYPVKGVHVLVEALRQLVGEPVALTIHGHLDWFPDYVAGLREVAAGCAVDFAGPFAPGDAGRVHAERDVLVVPSIWYENAPITISEAFASAVVPVVTDLGGMAEAVRDGVDGLCFPRGDAAGLADRLRRLAREDGLLARLAAARPDLPRVADTVDRLEQLYRASAPVSR